MKLHRGFFFFCIIFDCFVWHTAVAQETNQPIVQAILFYSPTCPHCHTVINESLPPLHEQYGDQLQILGIDTSQEAGQYLYQNAIAAFKIPQHRIGVPMLIVGDVVMVGSLEVPEQFPSLIEAGLAASGIGWPDIPDLRLIVPDLPPSAEPTQAEFETQATVEPTPFSTTVPLAETAVSAVPTEAAALSLTEIDTDEMVAKPAAPPSDPVGFALGWTVLLGLVVGLVFGVWHVMQVWPDTNGTLYDGQGRSIIIPTLILIGLGVAIYLSYVEMMQVTAVCGPVGECNIVQSSRYAQFLGMPVAVLGAFNYLTLGFLWLLRRPLQQWFPSFPLINLLALTLIGVFFSIYLTLLELLVIDAICAWCLTSAMVTTLLFALFAASLVKRPLFLETNVQAGD